VELWAVADSSELRDYMMLVGQRDDAAQDTVEGLALGFIVGGLDITGAVLGFTPACIVGTVFTFGTSCMAYATLVTSATIGAGWEIVRGIRGIIENHRLTDALPDEFFEIPLEAP
jgi:hypothetical protein